MSKELSLLSVQPHPDDESIGMGGTLARYSAEGLRTTLVTATRGEVGEILDKDLDPKEAAPRLATIREAELRNAVKILGVTELDFLGYSRAAEEIDDHVAYLEARGFVVVEEFPGRDPRRRVRLVRLTDLGVDYYSGRLPVDPGVYVERT